MSYKTDKIKNNLKNKDAETLSSKLDAYGRQAYEQTPESENHIEMIVDEKVSPAKFLPHPHKPGAFLANSLTIKAMKTDIFFLGDDINYTLSPCKSCHKVLERECWAICPYCGGEISEIICGQS